MAKRRAEGVSEEDVAAGAYFPIAKDWLDIGRRRLRYQIEKYVGAIYERSGAKYRVRFPLDTEGSFRMLRGLGYQATRKHFDYFVRHGHMKLPSKDGGRLAWHIENVVDFGMQLERMRYWLPGRHDAKKTVFELQAESDSSALSAQVAGDAEFQALDADGVLDRITSTKDAELRAEMAGYLPIRLFERGIRMDEPLEALLEQMIDEKGVSQRRALAKAIRKHLAGKEAK